MNIEIGINEKNRQTIANGFSQLLADTYTLYLKSHNFHWNVTGPMFTVLHELFETHYTELAGAVDEIAERIRALGFPAPASYSQFAKLTHIKEEVNVPHANEMIQQLASDHETVIRNVRQFLATIDSFEDEVSSDLLTQRLQFHEKTAWMLRSLLEKG